MIESAKECLPDSVPDPPIRSKRAGSTIQSETRPDGLAPYESARSGEAELHLQEALRISEKACVPEHSSVAASLNNPAGLLKATNRLPETEPLCRCALQIFVSFAFRNGHVHPHQKIVLINYRAILAAPGLDAVAIESRLQELLKPLNAS